MSFDVEKIMETLFKRLSCAEGFKTNSRRFMFIDQVPPTARPFFCLLEEGENYLYQSENLPMKLVIAPKIFIYISTPNKSDIPAKQLNILVKSISDILKPGPADQGRQTLDGLVSHCRIEGQVIKVPGDVDGDGNGMAVIPLRILADR